MIPENEPIFFLELTQNTVSNKCVLESGEVGSTDRYLIASADSATAYHMTILFRTCSDNIKKEYFELLDKKIEPGILLFKYKCIKNIFTFS